MAHRVGSGCFLLCRQTDVIGGVQTHRDPVLRRLVADRPGGRFTDIDAAGQRIFIGAQTKFREPGRHFQRSLASPGIKALGVARRTE